MNRTLTQLACAAVICCGLFLNHANSEETRKHNYKPSAGYVQTAEVAIRIAVAVWEPIYGKDTISRETPYNALLKDGVWYVSGSLPEGPPGAVVIGGVAEAEISQDDGRILRISHGK